MQSPSPASTGRRKSTISPEDKQRLLMDLDTIGRVESLTLDPFHSMWTPLAVEKKTEQPDRWPEEAITRPRSNGELLISRIPPAARNVKMQDLEDKYGGDIMAIKEAPQTDVPGAVKSRVISVQGVVSVVGANI